MNKKIAVISLSLIAVAFIIFLFTKGCDNNNSSYVDPQLAVSAAINHINKYVLQGQGEASLEKIYEIENKPYYKFQIDVAGTKYDSIVTADGSRLFTEEGIDLLAEQDEVAEGNFYVRNTDIIKEEGKPVVYLFTSSSCPHCQWQKPVTQEVIEKFGDTIIYKELEDTAEGQDVYQEYGKGGVPMIVLGGKYYREGAGEILGEEKEKELLTKYICELTEGQPSEVCN